MTNEQIATEVMGWKRDSSPPNHVWYNCYEQDGTTIYDSFAEDELPDFLSDHNAAQMVVEKMREDGYEFVIATTDCSGFRVSVYGEIGDASLINKSLCHAICEAALKAKGG